MIPVAIFCLLHFTSAANITNFKSNDFWMIGIIFYTIKFFPCLKKRKKIKYCIHYFDDFDYSGEKSDYKEILDECVSTCRRNSKIFFLGCVGAIIGLIGQTLMNLNELPINIWLPKFVIEKPVYFHTMQFLTLSGN